MSKYQEGDRVRFKGDTEVFHVLRTDPGGGLNLEPEDLFSDTAPGPKYVPARFLERVPVEVKPGQSWRGPDDEILFIVMEDLATPSLFHVATTGEPFAHILSVEYIRDNYRLEHDA